MAEYGNREIGIVQDALKEIYDELLDGGAVEFRKNLLRNLMQSMETKASWTTHAVAVFDAYQPLEKNFGNLNLETMVNYALANLEVLIEMEQLDNMRQPDQMWTGYEETLEAIEDIANALNEGFDFEIDTNQDVYDLTREISEQLEGSNIKVQDVPMALELQIRTLDDMKYFEFGSITAAFHSTEVMRPFTIQLVEIYNQIEDLPEDLVSNLYAEIADNLGLKEGPSDYLRAYDNPNNSEAKAVKNVIKYFFEQQGRQQTGYMNFSSVDNMYLDGGEMYSHIDGADSVAAYVGDIMQNNIEFFLPNSTQPVQLLNSVRPFEMASQPFPLEISGDYINEYNKIIGTTIIDNPTVSNKTVEAFADMNNLVTGEPLTVGDIAKELGLPERLHTIDLPSTPTNVVDDLAKQNELINNFVNSMKTEGNLEFYVKHSGTEVPASSIKYNPRIGKGSQIPGFYTEPLGIRDIKVMGGSGGPNAISNYYKVQVNSNNLLISAGGGKVTGLKSPISTVGNANLGNQIEKINWKIFEQETGLSWENDFNGKGLFSVERGEKVFSSNSQGFINYLKRMGLTDDEISSALRKSGIEGFVSGPTNAQYEVVLLDPNDELGIGKNINVQDATETDFVKNQSKVNQIDELIIDTPTNVVDLDEVISQSDGVDNLNKSKEIMQKNPGIFRKVFSVLEKLDIGDQVITKAVAKGLPALGLAAAAPGVAIAYGAYEMSILLTDAAQAYNKMQTTDEGFWENFGELSDKYSIAYKISKPVYDIILDSLNDDLTTEGQDEEILFSFNR